jgi:hypothetical protein
MNWPNWIDKKSKSISFLSSELLFFVVTFVATSALANSVCESRTILAFECEKWLEHSVRGTAGTENSLNTHISRLCSEIIAKP